VAPPTGAAIDFAVLLPTVDAFASEFTNSVKSSAPNIHALASVGEPDPNAAARSFSRAASDPDLARCLDDWCPVLLTSARPCQAADRLADLAAARRAAGTPLEIRHLTALPIVLGSSNFLARLLIQHPDWVDELTGTTPDPPAPVSPLADWGEIRAAKYRALLRIAARDLVGRPFVESLRELSDLADGCLSAAAHCTSRDTNADHNASPPAVFALGKLGGRELNFSSDVDLLFLYESPRGERDPDRGRTATNFIRHFKKQLELPSPDGFIYRVDLGLRPEGVAGALAQSVESALSYYEVSGADWERQMLIRLRTLGGPPAVASEFGNSIRPFVYRRSIDPSAIGTVREMKDKIERERLEAGRDLEADLKEGPGGIRDVEFLVQSFQLFWGARLPSLRTGNTLDGLAELAQQGLLPEATTEQLSDAYLWLRRAEHALQMADERQTSKFPREAAAQLRLARRMRYTEPNGEAARSRLIDDWSRVRSEVRAHFEAMVLRGDK
jgi:glutamine synthetase adenylyltransferase